MRIQEGDNEDTGVSANNNNNMSIYNNANTEVSPEDRNDEVQPLEETKEEDESSDDEEIPTATVTRSGRVSKPFDFAGKYPDIYGESEVIVAGEDTVRIRPYYYDDKLKQYLSEEMPF